MESIYINYSDLCEFLFLSKENRNMQNLLKFVGEKYNIDIDESHIKIIKNFYKTFSLKYAESTRCKVKFTVKYGEKWMKSKLELKTPITKASTITTSTVDLDPSISSASNLHTSTATANVSATSNVRPPKQFIELSERSKRRKTKELVDTHSSGELQQSYVRSLRTSIRYPGKKIVTALETASSRRANRLVSNISTPQE